MKRLALILAACSVVVFTAGRCAGNGGRNPEGDPSDVPADTAHTPAVELVMVYSNAYDGFLNVREKPDVKSPVIGKILNGPMGAVKMGEVGGWTVVKVGETIGYASSRYLQTTPTREFTDKDMEKCLQGIWMDATPMDQQVYMLFPEGVFGGGFTLEGYIFAGTWEVKGNQLILNHLLLDYQNDGTWETYDQQYSEIFTIESGDKIIDPEEDSAYTRVKLMSDSDYEAYTEKEGTLPWYKMTEEMWIQLFEGAHLHVKGSYPSGE